MRALITRHKVYEGTVPKYVYGVAGLKIVLAGFDSLDSAFDAAKRNGATFVVKQWGHAQTGAMHRWNKRQEERSQWCSSPFRSVFCVCC
jgi:hypothetical protein